MRKYLLLIFTLLLVSWVKAQGHYNGQTAIGANYLFTPKGNSYNLNYQQLIGSNFFGYRVDLIYVDKKDNFKLITTDVIPHKVYSIGASATYSLEKIIPFPFYVQLFAGPQYSYEEMKFKDKSEYTIDFKKPKANIYGANFGAEIEYLITPKFSILFTSLNRVSINSEINTFNPNYGFGVKYNF